MPAGVANLAGVPNRTRVANIVGGESRAEVANLAEVASLATFLLNRKGSFVLTIYETQFWTLHNTY